MSVDFLPVCDLPFFYFKILCIFGCAVSLLPLAGFLYRGGGLLLLEPQLEELRSGISCSVARGIFLDQGLKWCPLHC